MYHAHILSTKTIVPTLMEQASAAGIRIENRDFINIEPLISKDKADALASFNASTAVFTSTNAVEALYQLLQHYPNRFNALDVYCLAGRTAEKLRQLFPGLTVKGTANYGKDLAARIIADGVKEVIFFSGNLRRDDLPVQLKQSGIAVHELEIYKTHLSPVKMENAYDGLIFFSPSAAESFFSLNGSGPETLCFAIGETTAEALRKYTSNRIMVADIPRQENVISMIIEHFKK